MALPIQPKHSSSIVPTIFWWDNFDRFVDNLTWAGSIHNTPGIAFQEETNDTIKRNESSIIPSKRTSILYEEALPAKRPKIDPKKSPHMFNVTPNNSSATNVTSKHNLLSIWKTIRMFYENDQRFPRFAGLVIKLLQKEHQRRTVLTYLPPIEAPITDYGTLFELFYRSEQLAKQSNMKYTHNSGLWGCYESISRIVE